VAALLSAFVCCGVSCGDVVGWALAHFDYGLIFHSMGNHDSVVGTAFLSVAILNW